MLQKLDSKSAAHLLGKLVSLGDDYDTYGEKLEALGFVAFKAILESRESFAANTEQLNAHKMLRKEFAKLSFADPFFMSTISSDLYESPYQSEVITKLIESSKSDYEARENTHASPFDFIDPCALAELSLGPEIQAHRRKWRNKFQEFRNIEIERFLPSPHLRSQPNDREDKIASTFAYATLAKVLEPYGFIRNEKISSKRVIFFTKPLIGKWMLSFSIINEVWGFDYYSFETVDGKKLLMPKYFIPHFDLRLEGTKGYQNKDYK